jgi:hypothetical protein
LAYLGRQPIVGNFVKLDAITTSATATYNLLNGGVAYFPQTANNCIVSLNGVIQSPTSAYTISGSTIVFSDALTSSDTIDFILVLGDVLSIGTPSDGTITSAKLASGISGLISWQSVQTTGFTAVAARGYPCNTTSAAFTVTLPASPSVGDQVLLLDYAGTFDTNNLTVNPNSNKLEGGTSNLVLSGDREGVTLTYIDSTQGWLASSGIQEGTDALSPPSYSIDFLVIAGGGGGGSGGAGSGGGAGGYRTSTQSVSIGTAITVTVGDGGAGGATPGNNVGTQGSSSSISGSGLTTITSAGGGYGGAYNNQTAGAGGSGGGGSYWNAGTSTGGLGNTPSTSPSQGNNGGTGANTVGGGGGGAGATGGNGTAPSTGGNGGAGTASSITGSSVTRAGGGGGGTEGSNGGTGSGGGGNGGSTSVANTNGTANTGGGAGGGVLYVPPYTGTGGTGGKGVVILSVPTAKYSSTTTGSPTVTTSGSNTILQFNGSGSYTT